VTTEPTPRTTLPVAGTTNGAAPAAPTSSPTRPSRTFYDEVGGHETFVRLVDAFYRGVAEDPVLKPMYPEEDLGPAAERLTMFLEQYWGGPGTYSEERGHPRLRRRHAPFVIGEAERDAWLRHMLAALDALVAASGTPPELEGRIRSHLVDAADFLVNAR
jgi:hemoglobin